METILKMTNISKVFPGVKALDNVSLEVKKGEVHGLVGENGAGKSTLIKILSGAYTADSGTIELEGEKLNSSHIKPDFMIEKGVAVIYQEFMLAPHLTVAENIFLGRQIVNRFGMVDYRKMEELTRKECEKIGLMLDPKTRVCDLSVAKQQMVEIVKALSKNAKIIVLDEPTAVLGENELKGMFDVVKKLSAQGVSFIYISHRLKEVFQIADCVTIMKDGKVVGMDCIANYNIDKLICGMVGRELSDIYPQRDFMAEEVVLEVSGLNTKGKLEDINFKLHRGEILAISGLAGSGRSEIIRSVMGADAYDTGEILVYGKKVAPRSPKDGIRYGIGLLPEDRKREGLLLGQTVKYNIGITRFTDFMGKALISLRKERKNALGYMEKVNVRPNNPEMTVKNMSGGNQQKVVFCKWLNAKCKILLVDEPTRGIDVGAKQEIYRLLDSLTKQGYSIVMVSSELPEVLGVSDRVLVVHEGRIIKELVTKDTTEEEIMVYATGQADIAAMVC